MLTALRDQALTTWETVIAGSALADLNRVLQQMTASVDTYDFIDHAQTWSSMKGHLLSLQFNPRSPMDKRVLNRIHESVGQEPVLPNDSNVQAYVQSLIEVRQTLANAYNFDEANLGDDLGQGGWGRP